MGFGKIKVKGGVKKRFRMTSSGKIKRRRANHSHILTKKNAKRKRRLDSETFVHEADAKRIRRLLQA